MLVRLHVGAGALLRGLRDAARRGLRDGRGAVSTEYVIVIGTVGLLVMSAFLVIGPQLASQYSHARDILARPFP